MTTKAVVTATTDSRYMGYFSVATGWSMAGCVEAGEFYVESGSYFGCKTIRTGCTTASGGCVASGYSCITQIMHYTSPDPNNIGTRIKPVCVGGDWSAFDLYRTLPSTPTTTTTSAPPSSTLTPTASPAPSNPTSSPTSSSTSSPSSPTPAQPVSPGVIAGATIAGVALLAVVAFLIWFFGFHRRKAAAQQQQPSYVQQDPLPTWEQLETLQMHEVDGKGATVSHGYGYGYAPVSQGQQGNWAHQNMHEVGELAAEQRRPN